MYPPRSQPVVVDQGAVVAVLFEPPVLKYAWLVMD